MGRLEPFLYATATSVLPTPVRTTKTAFESMRALKDDRSGGNRSDFLSDFNFAKALPLSSKFALNFFTQFVVVSLKLVTWSPNNSLAIYIETKWARKWIFLLCTIQVSPVLQMFQNCSSKLTAMQARAALHCATLKCWQLSTWHVATVTLAIVHATGFTGHHF